MTGGREPSDASSDDEELVIVLQLLLLLCSSCHQWVTASPEVVRVLLFPVIFLVFS